MIANACIVTTFEIPELLEYIVRYLDPHDIFSCLCTCKTLAYHVQPLLWRNFHTNKQIDKDTLQRNLHYIRSVKIYPRVLPLLIPQEQMQATTTAANTAPAASASITPAMLRKGQGHLQIQKLTLCYGPPSSPSPTVLFDILDICPHLTYLKLPYRYLLKEPQDDIAPSLNRLLKLQSLEQLTIVGNGVWEETFCDLLDTCLHLRRLVVLKFYFSLLPQQESDEPASTILSKRKLRRDTKLTLRDDRARPQIIVLPSCLTGYSVQALLPLFRYYGQDLQSIQIYGIASDGPASVLYETIRIYCLRLKILRIDRFYSNIEPVLAMIRGCARKYSMTGADFNGQGTENHGLVRFACGKHKHNNHPRGMATRIIQTLAELHADTLEDISVHMGEALTAADLGLIVTTYKHLKRLQLGQDYATYNGQGMSDVFINNWVCIGLKELDLFLHNTTPKGNDDRDEVLVQLFGQLECLTNLETFVLSTEDYKLRQLPDSLFLDTECFQEGRDVSNDIVLEKLVALKKLRHLSLSGGMWFWIEQSEAEFMAANLSTLESFEVSDSKRDLCWDKKDGFCLQIILHFT
ncbi:hypothetical protein EDD11_000141 [Mortierella claussenii]|nr:hypothetical protein EDD11_000141 [Mortierella claussenii]